MEIHMKSTHFDRMSLSVQLEQLAETHLATVNVDTIAIFAKEAKRLVDNAFDNFIIEQENIFTGDGLRAIKDKTMLLAFTDMQNGYRSQMQDWVEKHPVELKQNSYSINDLTQRLPLSEREAIRRSASVLGIGSLAVLGLRFITGTSWTYLAELAVLALAGVAYSKGNDIDTKRLLQKHKVRLKATRINVVNSINSDLGQWLDLAEAENQRILQTFNINIL